MGQSQETEQPEGVDPIEVVRVGVDVMLALLSVYVFWTYVRERPEYEVMTARARAWWRKVMNAPADIRKAERETVFEAMQVVDWSPNDYGRTADDAGT